MAGCAITLFSLLLSLAEQIGFTAAYCVATLLTVGPIYGYTRRILTSRRHAALISGGLSTLCGYLFALLHEQEYALLAGSIELFLMLGLVMYLTRNIDWYQTAEQVAEKRPKQNKRE